MFVFHQFKIPTVVWGPSGGNTHGADEYVELDSVVLATKALLLFLCRRCGIDALGGLRHLRYWQFRRRWYSGHIERDTRGTV
jgi:hypothetical protein